MEAGLGGGGVVGDDVPGEGAGVDVEEAGPAEVARAAAGSCVTSVGICPYLVMAR